MQYLDNAPSSPQQSGGNVPRRPPHYYNYAKRNNQNPNRINAQRPQPNNRLPEDHTAEIIQRTSQNNNGDNNGTTLLVVLIIVILILTGGGIGLYFFMSKSTPPTPSKPRNATIQNPTSQATASSDQPDTTSVSTETDKGQQNKIGVSSIWIRDKLNGHFLGFNSEERDFSLDTLSTLQGVADLFEKQNWIHELYMDPEPREGLCDYFEENTMRTPNGKDPSSDSVPICDNDFKLSEDSMLASDFWVLPKKNHWVYDSSYGSNVEFSLITFTNNNKNFYITSKELNNIQKGNIRRRRLRNTNLITSEQLIEMKSKWRELPSDISPERISFEDVIKLLDLKTDRHPHHTHDMHVTSDTSGSRTSHHDLETIDFTLIHSDQDVHTQSPKDIVVTADDGNDRDIRFEDDGGGCDYDSEQLSEFQFERISFTLAISKKGFTERNVYQCHYHHSPNHHQRRILMHADKRSEPGSEHGSLHTAKDHSIAKDSPDSPVPDALASDSPDSPDPSVPHAPVSDSPVQDAPGSHTQEDLKEGDRIENAMPEHHDATVDGPGHATPHKDHTDDPDHSNKHPLPQQKTDNIESGDRPPEEYIESDPKLQVEASPIYVTQQYWGQIFEQTTCSQYDKENQPICKYILAVRGAHDSELQKTEKNYFRGCNSEWEIMHQGKVLQVVDNVNLIFITHIESKLKENEEYHIRHGVPFYQCDELMYPNLGDDAPIYEAQDDGGELPRQTDWADDLRRRLAAEDYTSNAFNKDNLFIIIGTTLFCLVVGIQSLYWLSGYY